MAYWRGSRQIGPRTVGPRQIGPRTVGPRGPVVRGPTVRPKKVANWAPEIYNPKNKRIIQKQNTALKIQSGMLPNINYIRKIILLK